MSTILNWLLARLKERSTWIGLTTVISATGAALSTSQAEAIGTAGAAIIGAILTFTADSKSSTTDSPQWEKKS